jgi:hypothetical protein
MSQQNAGVQPAAIPEQDGLHDKETAKVNGHSSGSDLASDERSDLEPDIEGDYGSGRDHVFANPKVADYWRNVYEQATYEGRHRFDPDFTWSAKEEKAVKRKVCSQYSCISQC